MQLAARVVAMLFQIEQYVETQSYLDNLLNIAILCRNVTLTEDRGL